MRTGLSTWLVRLSLLCVSVSAQTKTQDATKTRVPQYCLGAPFVAEDDSRWETGGGTVVVDDLIRLTPDLPSRTGYLWSKIPVVITDWEVEVTFKIHGQSEVGGEGLAFWFTEKRQLGSVFGSADYWNGLGIFFDTYNNDQIGHSPMIVAIYNDGTQSYHTHNDGEDQAIGSCQAIGLRNHHDITRFRISYLNGELATEVSFELEGEEPRWQTCFTVKIQLGVDKFFGLTAHTGHALRDDTTADNQVADNHDIVSVRTYALSTEDEDRTNAARERYKREVEVEHTQIKTHKDVNSDQFQHTTMTATAQILGQLQVLQKSQMTVGGMLEEDRRRDTHRDTVQDRRENFDVSKGSNDAKTMGEYIQSLLTTHQSLSDLINGASTSGGGARASTGGAESDRMLAQVREELKVIRNVLKRLDGGNTNKGRAGLGGTSSIPANMKNTIDVQLNGVQRGFKREVEKMRKAIENLQEDVLETNRQRIDGGGAVGSVSSGTASLSWTSTILLMVLLGEVIGVVVLQSMQPKDRFGLPTKRFP